MRLGGIGLGHGGGPREGRRLVSLGRMKIGKGVTILVVREHLDATRIPRQGQSIVACIQKY